jgi:D-glycero-D-manno-heptose 1,7-bisphosphate phosphatase
VSNQSGVGRGLITKEQVAAVNAEMMRQLGQDFFAGIYNCYAAPEDPWDQDRKPSPAMVLRAAKEHEVELAQSFMVGDRLSDVQCGQKAGCRTVLLLTEDDGWAEHAEAQKLADFVTTTLLEAVEWTLPLRVKH